MEKTTDETVSQQGGPILQLERSLLPIDEYAARQGVSVGIVTECARLGIIRIRKYKGKTFVVDVPLSPYRYMFDTADHAAQPTDKTAQARTISELVREVTPDASETPGEDTEAENQTFEPGTISALVKKMSNRAARITDKPAETNDDENDQIKGTPEPVQIPHPEPLEIIDEPAVAVDEITQTQGLDNPVRTPDLETLEIDDDLLELIDEIGEAEQEPELTRTSRDNEIQFALLTAQARSKRAWQVAVFFLMVSLFMVLLGSFWLYMDRKIQLNRLDQVYAGIRTVYEDSEQADRRAEALRSELADSEVELERIRGELNSSRAEARTVRKELTEAEQKLENIRNLPSWLPELTKNP